MSRATVLVKLQSVLGSPTGPDGQCRPPCQRCRREKMFFLPRSLPLALSFLPLNRCQHLKVNNIQQRGCGAGGGGAYGAGQQGQSSIWTQTFPTDSACQTDPDRREGDGATAVSSARAAAVMDGDKERKKEREDVFLLPFP